MRQVSLAAMLLVLVSTGAARAEGEVPMTLRECVEAALDANQDIALSRKDLEASRVVKDAAYGIFDPVLDADVGSSRQEQPTTSELEGAAVLVSESQRLSIGASQLLPTGGSVRFDFSGSRSDSNSSFAVVNPSYSSSWTLSVSHPLLKGLGFDATYYNIELQKLGEESSLESFELQVTGIVEDVENAYWDIVLAERDLEVKRQSLQVAEDLLAQNRIRVEVGTLAPIELVQAEAGVAQRKEAIIQAEALLKNTEEQLKRLMGVAATSELWDQTIRPVGDPETPGTPESLEEAVGTAFRERPEIRLAEVELQSRKLGTEYQRNQSRPQLDARASYSAAGVGGDETLFDPETGEPIGVDSGGFGDAWSQAAGVDFPTWSLGLSFSFPVLNRSARGSYASARISEEKALIQLERTRQDIDLEVRIAYRGVETARRSVEAARATERAQEKKLEAEQKKFENGLSTSFQVLEFDEDLSSARSQLKRTETEAHRAVLTLQRAMGTLLDVKGVELRP